MSTDDDQFLPRLTQHAQTRMQQRGISRSVVACLLKFGSRRRDSRGALVCFFDRHARSLVDDRLDPKQLRHVRDRLDCYAVLASSGAVITVGHRYRRLARP